MSKEYVFNTITGLDFGSDVAAILWIYMNWTEHTMKANNKQKL